MKSSRIPWLAYAALALSTSLVGSYIGLSKLLLAAFPVFLLAWLRFGFAAAMMLPWLRKDAGEATLDARTRGLLFLESFIGNFLFSICLLFGLQRSSALAAGVIMAGIPAAVALLSWAFLRERISARVGLAIACCVLGIGLVAFSRQGGAAETSWLGALLLLAAVFCEAAYVVIGKRLTASLSPRRISALINGWGLILVTPLGLWQALSFDFGAPAAGHWLGLVGYAAAASVLTVWLWMTGLKRVPAAQAGVFMVFLPLATGLVGLVFLGERLSLVQAMAYGLAVMGVILATTAPATAHEPAKKSYTPRPGQALSPCRRMPVNAPLEIPMTTPHPTHLRIHQLAGLKTGPRLLVTGAVHGNETAGVLGIERVLKELDSGQLTLLRGTLTMIPIVNPLAHRLQRREGERNLNRNLRPAPIPQDFEDRIANRLCPWLADAEVLLDLHSFNNPGPAFAMMGPAGQPGRAGAFPPRAGRGAVGGLRGHRPHRRGLALDLCAGPAAPRRAPEQWFAPGQPGAGSALRRRHHRVHAQPGRLRHHPGMRPACRPARPRGRLQGHPANAHAAGHDRAGSNRVGRSKSAHRSAAAVRGDRPRTRERPVRP